MADTGTRWDPSAYLAFAAERSRPFADLVSRISAGTPHSVVDLGCGPGQLTASLAERWPTARVLGLDASPEMIAAANAYASQLRNDQLRSRLRFGQGDVEAYATDSTLRRSVDVLISNATLQWVPNHRTLLSRLVATLRPGGFFALQVPGNLDQPSHRLLRELAAEPPYGDYTNRVEEPEAFGPEVYLADLAAAGADVDAWETTYLHVLPGDDPILHWMSGTGARPVLQALPDGLREEFKARYRAELRAAYPHQPFGTVLPFRRVFAVATLPN